MGTSLVTKSLKRSLSFVEFVKTVISELNSRSAEIYFDPLRQPVMNNLQTGIGSQRMGVRWEIASTDKLNMIPSDC